MKKNPMNTGSLSCHQHPPHHNKDLHLAIDMHITVPKYHSIGVEHDLATVESPLLDTQAIYWDS